MSPAPGSLATLTETLPDVRRWRIAFSGGLDSTVLLHLAANLRPQLSVGITAVHVNHGLHPEADEWSRHCRYQCEQRDIPIEVLEVDARAGPGESPEAAAREARYRAIAAIIEDGDCLLTAHHRDDQAETLLLQLLRGAGPHGLAAMPTVERFASGWHARPLLDCDQEAIRRYAGDHDLGWIDDPSNQDTGLRRNFLRHEILPRLKQAWPAAARTLSRSAAHNAAATRLLDELAREDLGLLSDDSGATLSVSALTMLDPDRQANVLRGWLHHHRLPLPATTHLERLREDVLAAGQDSNPLLAWPGAEIRRHRDRLYAMAPLPPHDPRTELSWDLASPLALPGGGRLRAAPAGNGRPAARCLRPRADGAGPVTVRFRLGGERCRPAGRNGTHSLKQLLQEAGIPPWLRQRVPLLYFGDSLAAVAGVCVCEDWQAPPEAGGLEISWSGLPGLARC